MARPIKDTVLYFSHDADASNGKTVTILESHFGVAGYAFWFKLLEMLADSPGHVITCRNYNDWQFLLAKTKVDEKTGAAILEKLCDLGALDRELWESKLIWSDNFVERLSDVYKNRRRDLPCKPLLPVETPQEASLLPVETPQSIVYGIKENNSKENIINTVTAIYEYWNGNDLTKHKELTDKRKSAISARLEGGYTEEELKQAISNYSEIVNDNKMMLSQKWTIEEFMSPTRLDKFMSLDAARDFYMRRNGGPPVINKGERQHENPDYFTGGKRGHVVRK